ncbi:MAG: AMP-binding protein [Verrucomicrobiaceae bacterium]|nr:AMP-binding protein [Verrucomicrobiaceae bacterium]
MDERFWEQDDVHVALPPGVEAPGLAQAAASLSLGGVCLFQTSGSEGVPKWVVLRREAMLASARAVCAHLEIGPADRWLLALPQLHVGGFSIWARAAVSGCGVVQASVKWSPLDFCDQITESRSTVASLVPAQVFDLVRAQLRCPKVLRAAVVGGAGLDKALGDRARELGWPLLQSYGMTETSSQVATEPLEHLNGDFLPSEMRVLPVWRLGEVNELMTVQGAPLAVGYMTNGGGKWRFEPMGEVLVTRDKGRISEREGHQWMEFIGREKGMLKVLGELVSMHALQAILDRVCLENDSASSRMVVAAEPDERLGHRLLLWFHSTEYSVTQAEAVRAEFNRHVRPFERIAHLQPSAVPVTNSMGKVMSLANDEKASEEST